MGYVYLTLEKPDKVKDSFEKTLKLQPEQLEAKINLFFVLKAMNLSNEAIKLGKEIISKTPQNITVHKGLKEIYLKTGKEDQIIEELNAITTLTPYDKDSWKELAQIYEKQKDLDKAKEVYEKVLELDSKDKDALLFTGRLLYEKKNYGDAIKRLEKLVKLDSSYVLGKCYLGASYLKNNDLARADVILNAIDSSVYQQLNNEDKKFLSDVQFILGNKFLQEGNLKQAKLNLRASLMIFKTEKASKVLAKVYASEGDALFSKGAFRAAIELYNNSLELDRNNLEYQGKLSKAKEIVATKRRKAAIIGLIIIASAIGLLITLIVRYDRSFHRLTDLSVTASSYHPEHPPQNVIDGDTLSFWLQDPLTKYVPIDRYYQWIKVKLPKTKLVRKIGIYPGVSVGAKWFYSDLGRAVIHPLAFLRFGRAQFSEPDAYDTQRFIDFKKF